MRSMVEGHAPLLKSVESQASGDLAGCPSTSALGGALRVRRIYPSTP